MAASVTIDAKGTGIPVSNTARHHALGEIAIRFSGSETEVNENAGAAETASGTLDNGNLGMAIH